MGFNFRVILLGPPIIASTNHSLIIALFSYFYPTFLARRRRLIEKVKVTSFLVSLLVSWNNSNLLPLLSCILEFRQFFFPFLTKTTKPMKKNGEQDLNI